jgi:hypothetical protein
MFTDRMNSLLILAAAFLLSAHNNSLENELISMVQVDQELRSCWIASPSSEDEEKIKELDCGHVKRLKEIVLEYGWPGISVVGKEGAHAFWLLVQHTPDRTFQKECLELLRDRVAKIDAEPADLAYLEDRVRVFEGKAQVYGTQVTISDGVLRFYPIEDIEHIDERRVKVGLGSFHKYHEHLSKLYRIP